MFELIVWLSLFLSGERAKAPAPAPAPNADQAVVSAAAFEQDVLPIVKRCQPCHFPGGTMHERLPFDRPATIVHLGEKLFTRIRNEREREAIRSFLKTEASRRGR